MVEDEERIVLNGIDGSSGEYLTPPLTVQQVSAYIQQEAGAGEPLGVLRPRHQRDTEDHLGVVELVADPQDLAQAGWGVLFPATLPAVELAELKAALKPLLDWRKEQAGAAYYKEYSGPDGYQPGDTVLDWLPRHGRSPADRADPAAVPYYLLLVGDPETIPYAFQFHLDVVYATGRLWFDPLPGQTRAEWLACYQRYAQSVVAAETAPGFRPRRAAFFGVATPGDSATQRSAAQLVAPLVTQLTKYCPDWRTDLVPPEMATKDQLGELLGGPATPSLLFTASHGMGFRLDDDRQARHQGALLCGDWPGPDEWRGRGRIPADFYFSADDVSADAQLQGLIAFHFACFGAGTPKFDDFGQGRGLGTQLAPQALVAPLPQRLLSHPQGGALAVIGHVDRAWTYSFAWNELQSQTDTFRDTLLRIMRGQRVGWATEYFNERYAALATSLSTMLADIQVGRIPDDLQLSSLWTAHNDARSYVIFGDPAVRLPLPPVGAAPAAPPTLVLNRPAAAPLREPGPADAPAASAPEAPGAGR